MTRSLLPFSFHREVYPVVFGSSTLEGYLAQTSPAGRPIYLGVLVALNVDVIVPFIEHLLGVQFLSKDIYFISTVPSDLRWPDVAKIGGLAVVLAFLATLYPSFAASRVKPAEALRYE